MANNFASDSRCVAYWRFEPGALTTDSKGTCTLTASTSPPTSDAADYKEGTGSANFVNASHQYYAITDANLPTGFPFKNTDTVKNATVCFWIKLSGNASQNYGVISKRTYGAGNWGIYITTANLLVFCGNGVDNNTKTLTPGVWYHVSWVTCATERTYYIRIYNSVDGQIDIYAPINTPPTPNTNDFRIGTFADQSTNYTFNGKLDEIVVFNSCLNVDELDAIRNQTFPLSYPAPVAASNDFSGDSSCVAVWRLDPDNYLADSKGSHTLMSINGVSSLSSGSCATNLANPGLITNFKEGAGGALFVSDYYQGLKIPDASLAANFPLKSTDTTKTGTVCFWVKPMYYSNEYRGIVCKMDTVNNYRTFWSCIYGNILYLMFGSGTGTTHDTYNTGLTIDPYYWHHVSIMFDGVNKWVWARVWSERTGVGTSWSAGLSNVIWVGGAPVTIGKLSYTNSAAECFYGYIDEVVVFNRPLSFPAVDLIRQGKYSGTGPSYSNDFSSVTELVSRWRFESGALTTDSVGTNTLVAQGTPTQVVSTTGPNLIEKEGTGCVYYARASSQGHYVTDANLSANFPFKSTGQSRAMTFMAWVRPYSNAPNGQLYCIACKFDWNASKVCWEFQKGFDNTRHYVYLNVGRGTSGQLVDNISTQSLLPNTNVMMANQWTHLTICIDGINQRAFFRMYEEATGAVRHFEMTTQGPTRVVDTDFTIGFGRSSGAGTVNCFDGVMDDILVFNRVLSIQDIDSIRQGSFSGSLSYPAHVQGTFAQVGLRYPDNRRRHCIDPLNGVETATGYSWSEAWKSPQGKIFGSGDIVYVAKNPEFSLPFPVSATNNSTTLVSTSGLNLATDDVIRIGGFDQMNSVASCSGLTITLWRPYRGSTAAGLTVTRVSRGACPDSYYALTGRGLPGATISMLCGYNTSTGVQDGYTLYGSPNQVTYLTSTTFNFWELSRIGFWNGLNGALIYIGGIGYALNKVYIFKSGYINFSNGGPSYNIKGSQLYSENAQGLFGGGSYTNDTFEFNDCECFGTNNLSGWVIASSWHNGIIRRLRCGNGLRFFYHNINSSVNLVFQEAVIGEGLPIRTDLYLNATMINNQIVFRNCLYPQGNFPVMEFSGTAFSGEYSWENYNQQGTNFTWYGRYINNQYYAAMSSSDNNVYRTVPPSIKVFLSTQQNAYYGMPITIPLNAVASANVPITIGAWMRKNSAYGNLVLPTLRLRYLTGTLGNPVSEFGPMSTNVDPAPYVVSASVETSGRQAWNAFFDTTLVNFWQTNVTTGWLKAYVGPTAQTVSAYSLKSRTDGALTEMPKNWTFEGSNDDITYTVLDTQTNQTWTLASQVYTYTVSSAGAYKYYRLNITANNGAGGVSITRLRLFYTGFSSPSNLSVTETNLVMADVNDTWTQVSTTITPANAGVVDLDLVLASYGTGGIVWIDDITVT